ncbi:MAG: hypothetical protein KJ725_16130, partial [Gammaproteobacteria bacterium]|nr:hypothetical protein [Gammaproteobacteria bacterium]
AISRRRQAYMEVFTQHLNSIVHWLWLTTVDNLGAGFTASCQASHRIAAKPTTCSSYFVHISYRRPSQGARQKKELENPIFQLSKHGSIRGKLLPIGKNLI